MLSMGFLCFSLDLGLNVVALFMKPRWTHGEGTQTGRNRVGGWLGRLKGVIILLAGKRLKFRLHACKASVVAYRYSSALV